MSFSDRKEGLEEGLREHERERKSVRPEPFPGHPRYEIRGSLGEGATAVVYRAWDRELNRLVALKVLRDSMALYGSARERFRREAEAAGKLVHPHVVTVLDAGEHEGKLYLVMELVEGRTLSEILRAGDPPQGGLVEILEKVARGVAEAHGRGIIHRDLKPGNVLVSASGDPKVADFGLAHLSESSVALTGTGTVLGTPLYMAPEQVQGRTVSPATDVYALGAILYEILTGRPPHAGQNAVEIYQKIVHEEPEPPRKSKPETPAALQTIALRALEKEADGRYPDAGALAEDLRRFRLGEPVATYGFPGLRRLRRKVRRHAVAIAFATAAVAIASGTLLWTAVRQEAAERTQAEEREFLLQVPQIEEARGPVTLAGGPAAVARKLLSGESLEAGTDESFAVLKFPDLSTVELGGKALVRAPRRDEVPGLGRAQEARALILERGRLLLKTNAKAPVVILTELGRIESSRFVGTVLREGGAVRLEVKAGEAAVTLPQGGRPIPVKPGEYLVLTGAADPSPQPSSRGSLQEFVKKKGVDDSLAGYWRLDEGRGDEVADALGRGLRGKLLEGARWASDGSRQVISLNGKGSRVELPGAPELDGLQDRSYTLSAWYRPDSLPQGDGKEFFGAAILMKGGWREGLFFAERGNFWMLHWIKPATWASTGSGKGYPAGRWRHLAGVADYETRRTEVYVDAEPAGSLDWPAAGRGEDFGGLKWMIGQIEFQGKPTYFAHGAVRDVRFYSRALSRAEVEAVFHAELLAGEK